MINVWLAVSPTLAAQMQAVGTGSSTLPPAMQDQVQAQRGFDAATVAGLFAQPGGWLIYNVYLDELGDWPAAMAEAAPTQHRILGAWDVWTGEAAVPQADDLIDWLPPQYDGEGALLPPVLRDVVLLSGQAPRQFT